MTDQEKLTQRQVEEFREYLDKEQKRLDDTAAGNAPGASTSGGEEAPATEPVDDQELVNALGDRELFATIARDAEGTAVGSRRGYLVVGADDVVRFVEKAPKEVTA